MAAPVDAVSDLPSLRAKRSNPPPHEKFARSACRARRVACFSAAHGVDGRSATRSESERRRDRGLLRCARNDGAVSAALSERGYSSGADRQAAAAASARFLTISRFSATASDERSPSLCLTRKLSSPPRCSTERRAAAATRRRTERPSVSEISVTWHRFGRKRVRVFRFEWLTLLPDWTALPVSSQRRDIAKNPSRIGWRAAGRSGKDRSRPEKRPQTHQIDPGV